MTKQPSFATGYLVTRGLGGEGRGLEGQRQQPILIRTSIVAEANFWFFGSEGHSSTGSTCTVPERRERAWGLPVALMYSTTVPPIKSIGLNSIKIPVPQQIKIRSLDPFIIIIL